MAKKRSTNKTAAIREALKTTSSPAEVSAQLSKQGIKVTPAYVSTIKANDKRKAQRGGPGKPGRPPVGSVSKLDLQQTQQLMLDAVDLVAAAGADEARKLVGMAEQVVSRVR